MKKRTKKYIYILLILIFIIFILICTISITGNAVKNKTQEKIRINKSEVDKISPCIDSDNGLNYAVKGNASIILRGKKIKMNEDRCYTSELTGKTYLKEAICKESRFFSAEKPDYKKYLCPSCDNGICVE